MDLRYYIGLFSLLLVFMLAGCSSHKKGNKIQVVVIQSFGQSHAVQSQCEQTVYKVFRDEDLDVKIHSIYLNSEDQSRGTLDSRMQMLLDSCSWWKPSVILVYDDVATDALLRANMNIVYDTPVIFAGVNFPDWSLIEKFKNVTGYTSTPEYMKAADMANELFHPQNISFWMNQSEEGQMHIHALLMDLKYGRQIYRICNSERSMHYRLVTEQIFALEPDSTPDAVDYANKHYEAGKPNIVLLNYNQESAKNLLSILSGKIQKNVFITSQRADHSQKFALMASAPTFTTVSEGFGIDEGILGGYFPSAESEWSNSAKLAADVLNGTNISTIPVRMLKKEYWIDYRELSRWHIDMKDLPSNYKIANLPFYIKHRISITWSFWLFLFVVLVCISILVHLYHKEKVRRLAVLKKIKEEEEFRELAMRGSKVYAFNIDKTGMRFDKDFCMIYGGHFQNISIDDFIHFIDKPYWYSFQKDVEMMNIGTLNNGNIRHAPLNLTGKGYEWWEFRFNFSRLNMTISGILFNIQQMKQEEEELRISREKVLESEKMKSVFLASMSHEIRTPLNAIVGFSNLIADDVDSELTMEQKQEFKQQINTNNEMLLKLFNDILDLSQLVGGQMELKKDACDLSQLMLDMFNQYKPLMHEGVEMSIQLPEKATILQTDVKRLTQVIRNIVNNARKFTLKGHILIGYEEGPENGQVSLFIEDTGVGIPKELQEKIFGRFTKLDSFKQGTGIGLAISRSIILQMGGSISLKSELDSGSRFIITLPIVEKEQDFNPIVK